MPNFGRFYTTSDYVLRAPSADRPETLPHDWNLAEFYNPTSKTPGLTPNKIWGPKHAKFPSILDHFRIWSRISPERLKISKIGKRTLQTMAIPPAFNEKSPVNFGPLTAWNYMWVWTGPSAYWSHSNGVFRETIFRTLGGAAPWIFTRARDGPSFASAQPEPWWRSLQTNIYTQTGTGFHSPPPKKNRENSKSSRVSYWPHSNGAISDNRLWSRSPERINISKIRINVIFYNPFHVDRKIFVSSKYSYWHTQMDIFQKKTTFRPLGSAAP